MAFQSVEPAVFSVNTDPHNARFHVADLMSNFLGEYYYLEAPESENYDTNEVDARE